MTTATERLQCFNKGCGINYSQDQDGPEACVHHPGVPVFHDALKGWSCCKKRTTDFTEFLNIPGCSKSNHNPVKPVEEPKKESNDVDEPLPQPVQPLPVRQPIQAADPADRPSADEPKIRLPVSVDSALRAALEKMSMNVESKGSSQNSQEIKIGTQCKNKGCQKEYQGPSSYTDRCRHHPGAAIFHEGMKYWSCCNRKTSDFNNFLNQEGCSLGDHVFKSDNNAEKKTVSCRHDWHQTGKVAVLSVYCKKADPSLTVIEANQVSLDVHIVFGQEKSEFEKKITLEGVVDPSSSVVNMLGTKVEIKLQKAGPQSWKKFEI
ncbi:cysteine and histidine-rich domain-containing protein 1-like [Diadema antillarum]|uniref:cysteine and histidine-rich domain-containing protein 1-like n=1 Tax=Diadema antillarum TaxID=105358 RepID=UPI003A86D6ED